LTTYPSHDKVLWKAQVSWDITRLYQRCGCITLFRNVC